jgi:transmembrane sensor
MRGMFGQATELRRGRGEAAKWFEVLHGRTVSDRALRDFQHWRRNPANAAAFIEVESTWNRAIAILHHKNRIARAAEAVRRRRGRAPWVVASRYDLAIGLALIVGSLVLGAAWTSDRPRPYSTGLGEQRQILLSDGSRIRLNADSRLWVIDRGGLPHLVLDRGAAFIEAASHPPHPLDIRAGPADLSTSGAKLSLRRGADGVHVSLVEGAAEIRLMPSGPSQRLAQGQEAVVTATRIDSVSRVAGATGRISGRRVFPQTPLRAAAAEVNRYASREIDLDAGGASDPPIGGQF